MTKNQETFFRNKRKKIFNDEFRKKRKKEHRSVLHKSMPLKKKDKGHTARSWSSLRRVCNHDHRIYVALKRVKPKPIKNKKKRCSSLLHLRLKNLRYTRLGLP